MNWTQFKNTILDTHFKGKWQVKFGEAFYRGEDGDGVACVRIRVSPSELDPAFSRIELSTREEDVDFEIQTYSLQHGINGDEDTQGFIALLSYLFPGIPFSVYPPLPANHVPPERFDLSPFEVKTFEQREMSKTPLAPLYGQHRDYFSSIVLELNTNPNMGQVEEWPIRYRQGWIEKVSCPFCLGTNYSSLHAVALRYPEQVRYSSDYLILICPRCERAIETIPYE